MQASLLTQRQHLPSWRMCLSLTTRSRNLCERRPESGGGSAKVRPPEPHPHFFWQIFAFGGSLIANR